MKESFEGKKVASDGKKKLPHPVFFIILGLTVVFGFSILHIILSALIYFLIGFDFTTVLYVSAAALTTGTVITMALALLISLYCILSFLASLHSSLTSSNLATIRDKILAKTTSMNRLYRGDTSNIDTDAGCDDADEIRKKDS